MTTLQRALDDTTRHLSIRAPIVATSGMLKLTPALGSRLDHHKYLDTGLHQFVIVQHTSTTRKLVKFCADQHQVIAGGGAAPSLADTAMLMKIYCVSLSSTLAMAQGPTCS